jgi:hypothetical protein
MIPVYRALTATTATDPCRLVSRCSSGMEQTACWAALAFCSGWVAREFFVSKPPAAEPPACTCNCHWQGKSTEVTWNPPYSVLILLALVGFGLIFSQTALAFKISYQDDRTGEDRSLSVAVKGKSKGVFGAKGLQLRG